MKTVMIAAASLAFASAAHAQDRTAPAALGALSGAVVLGPVGLVAGAVIGYTAGPEIGRAWKIGRGDPRYRAKRAARPAKRNARAVVQGRASAPAAGVVTPAPGTGGPPAQGLE